ncbi:MAG: hypothetical protein ABSB82_03285 [Terriglobia bacterium]|jgi:hypothetical protein
MLAANACPSRELDMMFDRSVPGFFCKRHQMLADVGTEGTDADDSDKQTSSLLVHHLRQALH